MARRITTLLTKEHAADWKPFVAEYVVLLTAKKANRELSSEYGVVKVGTQYEIIFGTLRPYRPMDAETLYGWMIRLPLNYWVAQADNWRYEIMSAA